MTLLPFPVTGSIRSTFNRLYLSASRTAGLDPDAAMVDIMIRCAVAAYLAEHGPAMVERIIEAINADEDTDSFAAGCRALQKGDGQ